MFRCVRITTGVACAVRFVVLALHPFGSVALPVEDQNGYGCITFYSWILYGLALIHLLCCSQADIVFWLGDLNYRISEEVPDEQVFEMLKNNDLDTLRRVL